MQQKQILDLTARVLGNSQLQAGFRGSSRFVVNWPTELSTVSVDRLRDGGRASQRILIAAVRPAY
jgi:hypothetical protein